MIRRRLARRLTSALFGAAVTAIGALAIVAMSGHDIDMELVVIVALFASGGWLLLTAAIAGVKPRRAADSAAWGPSGAPSATEGTTPTSKPAGADAPDADLED